jgi:hypothetical protein
VPADPPHLGREDASGGILWQFSWFLRKNAETPPGDWALAWSKASEALPKERR